MGPELLLPEQVSCAGFGNVELRRTGYDLAAGDAYGGSQPIAGSAVRGNEFGTLCHVRPTKVTTMTEGHTEFLFMTVLLVCDGGWREFSGQVGACLERGRYVSTVPADLGSGAAAPEWLNLNRRAGLFYFPKQPTRSCDPNKHQNRGIRYLVHSSMSHSRKARPYDVTMGESSTCRLGCQFSSRIGPS